MENNKFSYYQKSQENFSQKNFQKSLIFIQKEIKFHPLNSEAHLLKAKIYSNLRQFSSSLNSYKKVLKLLPNNTEAIYGEGKCFKELGFFHEAISKFQQLKINAKAFNSIGTCHYCMGNKEEAIHQYNKAIQLNPNYTEAYFNKGICLSNLNKKEDAILMYNII